MEDADEMMPTPKVTLQTFVEPLKLLAEKDILVSLLFGGVVYTVWSIVVASTTRLFKERFGLSELTLGLVFLPNGIHILPLYLTSDLLTFSHRAWHYCWLYRCGKSHDARFPFFRAGLPRT